MNSRIKLLAGLLTVTVVSGAAYSILREPSPKSNASESELIAELPEGEEPDKPLIKCIFENAEVVKEILKVDQYTLFSYRYLPQKVVDKKAYENAGTDKDLGPTYPNIDVAVMVVDPFIGCKPLIRSMRAEQLPQSLPDKKRLVMRKAYWATSFYYVEQELNVTAQSWLDTVTHFFGPGMPPIGEDDIKALASMKMDLPEWYSPDIPEEKRWEVVREAGKRGNNKGVIPRQKSP